MINPSSQWSWKIVDKQLCADTGQRLVSTCYRDADLLPFPKPVPFDVSHMDSFSRAGDGLASSGIPFNDDDVWHVALHSVAALHFHRPTINKSWYYDKQATSSHVNEFELGWLFLSNQPKLVYRLAKTGDTAFCLNLSESFTTADNKIHPQFSVISVLSNRLLPLHELSE